jgi:hypothetical protein
MNDHDSVGHRDKPDNNQTYVRDYIIIQKSLYREIHNDIDSNTKCIFASLLTFNKPKGSGLQARTAERRGGYSDTYDRKPPAALNPDIRLASVDYVGYKAL